MKYPIESKVLSRIYGARRGYVFTPSHFLDLGRRSSIDVTLFQLVKRGTIRQLARGLYDYPQKHAKLGLLSPSVDAIAQAMKGRDAVRIQPSGAYAANLLGLSEQVPMRAIYLTDGPNRKVQVGKQTVEFKRTTPRNLATANRISGLVIHALRHLGQKRVDDGIINHLRNRLSKEDKSILLKDLVYAPAWIAGVIRKITEEN